MSAVDDYGKFLWTQEEKINTALPDHVKTKRFISQTIQYLTCTPTLLEKNKVSLFNAILEAARTGLYIDGQEAALTPKKENVVLSPMYRGLLKLVRNSGELKDINAEVVYANDEFDYHVDETGEHLTHRRVWTDRGERLLVYCIARTKDDGVYIETMDRSQVLAVKNAGFGGSSKSSPWNGPFQDEMWKKSSIRRLHKRLPSSTDMDPFAAAIHADDSLFIPDETAPEEPPTTSKKLTEAVAVKEEPKEAKAPVETVKAEDDCGLAKGTIVSHASKDCIGPDGETVTRFAVVTSPTVPTTSGDEVFITLDKEIYKQIVIAKEHEAEVKIGYKVTPSGVKQIACFEEVIPAEEKPKETVTEEEAKAAAKEVEPKEQEPIITGDSPI